MVLANTFNDTGLFARTRSGRVRLIDHGTRDVWIVNRRPNGGSDIGHEVNSFIRNFFKILFL